MSALMNLLQTIRWAAGQFDDGFERAGTLLRACEQVLMSAAGLGLEMSLAFVIHGNPATRRNSEIVGVNRVESCTGIPHRPVVWHLHVIAIGFGQWVVLHVGVI